MALRVQRLLLLPGMLIIQRQSLPSRYLSFAPDPDPSVNWPAPSSSTQYRTSRVAPYPMSVPQIASLLH
eukprot:2376224-Rhodomonas_salina.1